MTSQDLNLVLFSDDVKVVAALKQRFALAPHITVTMGNGPTIANLHQLNALWVSPMQASYFGVHTRLPKHIGQVFEMPLEKQAKGLPKFLITGAVMTPEDPTTPSFAARLCVEALAHAVSKHNQTKAVPILRIGSTPNNLCLDDRHVEYAAKLLERAFAPIEPDELLTQIVTQFA